MGEAVLYIECQFKEYITFYRIDPQLYKVWSASWVFKCTFTKSFPYSIWYLLLGDSTCQSLFHGYEPFMHFFCHKMSSLIRNSVVSA